MIRYKILIEYLGTNFSGWQKQKNSLGIQQIIEEAISKFSNEKTNLYGAGRTDAGVHALGQVAHFDLLKYFEPSTVIDAINYFLKAYCISILDCVIVTSEFHARFSAKKRYYLYRIINRNAKVSIEKNKVWWIKSKLNLSLIEEASNYLIGWHDFSSFKCSDCYSRINTVNLEKIKLEKSFDELYIIFVAQYFFYKMVRNIVGTLVMVGLEKLLVNDIVKILDNKIHSKFIKLAPASGLYLLKIEY